MSSKASPEAPIDTKSATVILATPIERKDGVDVASLTLRKPTAGELRGLHINDLIQGDVNAIITLVPRIAQPFVIEQEVARLEIDDFAEISGAILGFFMTPSQKAMLANLKGERA